MRKRRESISSDLEDHADCLGRNPANLRADIPELVKEAVRDAVSEFMKDLKKSKKYVKVGYRS